MLHELTTTPLFGVTLSLMVYLLSVKIAKKINNPILNPIIISTTAIIAILSLFKIPYENFNIGGDYLTAMIAPATVALAIPLYKNYETIKANRYIILIGIIFGVIIHALMVACLIVLWSFNRDFSISLLMKSVTTAIAMDMTSTFGGIVPLSVVIVIATGVSGLFLSPFLIRISKISDPVAQGIAIGTTCHVVGASKAMELGETQGSMASIAVVIAGIVTVALIPLVMALLDTHWFLYGG